MSTTKKTAKLRSIIEKHTNAKLCSEKIEAACDQGRTPQEKTNLVMEYLKKQGVPFHARNEIAPDVKQWLSNKTNNNHHQKTKEHKARNLFK